MNIYSNDNHFWTDTFSITVVAPDNLDDISIPDFRIYPNPVTHQLMIEFNNLLSQETSIALYDIAGKVVYSENPIRTASTTFTINLSSLGKGLYFIHISDDRYTVTEKVIKVK